MRHRSISILVLAAASLVLGACQSAGATRSFTFTTLNESGVSGTVTLVEVGGSRTRVEIVVDPAGNLDMPAHIHPGSCADLVPQPKYPLENVRTGKSTTEVPAAIGELTAGSLAVNVHKSVDDLQTYTACADLR